MLQVTLIRNIRAFPYDQLSHCVIYLIIRNIRAFPYDQLSHCVIYLGVCTVGKQCFCLLVLFLLFLLFFSIPVNFCVAFKFFFKYTKERFLAALANFQIVLAVDA